jgi:hypothetical protein
MTDSKPVTSADYTTKAEECLDEAARSRSNAQKTLLLQRAETWHRMAEDLAKVEGHK